MLEEAGVATLGDVWDRYLLVVAFISLLPLPLFPLPSFLSLSLSLSALLKRTLLTLLPDYYVPAAVLPTVQHRRGFRHQRQGATRLRFHERHVLR